MKEELKRDGHPVTNELNSFFWFIGKQLYNGISRYAPRRNPNSKLEMMIGTKTCLLVHGSNLSRSQGTAFPPWFCLSLISEKKTTSPYVSLSTVFGEGGVTFRGWICQSASFRDENVCPRLVTQTGTGTTQCEILWLGILSVPHSPWPLLPAVVDGSDYSSSRLWQSLNGNI